MKVLLKLLLILAILLFIGGVYEIIIGELLSGIYHVVITTIVGILSIYALKILKNIIRLWKQK